MRTQSVREQAAERRVASASLLGRTVEKDLAKDEHMLGDSIKNMWVALVLLVAVMVLVANKEAVYQWVLWALGRKKKFKVSSRCCFVCCATRRGASCGCGWHPHPRPR